LLKRKFDKLSWVKPTSELSFKFWETLSKSIIKNITPHTDIKENKISLIYKEVQLGSVAKSYMRKGFLIYKEMRKYLTKYEEAISHI
jgi:hypothetical protein